MKTRTRGRAVYRSIIKRGWTGNSKKTQSILGLIYYYYIKSCNTATHRSPLAPRCYIVRLKRVERTPVLEKTKLIDENYINRWSLFVYFSAWGQIKQNLKKKRRNKLDTFLFVISFTCFRYQISCVPKGLFDLYYENVYSCTQTSSFKTC